MYESLNLTPMRMNIKCGVKDLIEEVVKYTTKSCYFLFIIRKHRHIEQTHVRGVSARNDFRYSGRSVHCFLSLFHLFDCSFKFHL